MRFLFPHSHAFRKGRVTVEDDGKTAPDCLVEFGDGVTIIAQWHAEGDASTPRFAHSWSVSPMNDRLARRRAS